ncbi:MAG: Eco57I restriction-modification methylase domain-containing protein [Desulfobulbus sp.]|jgi:hypothetical protein
MNFGKLSKHAEWLSLIEISGPFLTVPILDKVFPQGLEAVETPRRRKLGAAYEEWREAVDQEDKLLPELHREWVRLVLTELLEYDRESLVHADDWPNELLNASSQEHAGSFKPDWIVRPPGDGNPRLFIAVLPPDTDLESVQRGDGRPVSLQERMILLCRAHGVRLGLLTNGERWMLVNAPVDSTSSQASWYARLWFQEPITLKAFQSLLGVRRCFGPAEDTLEALLTKSLEHQEEVTDTLGEQVRRAVEVLVQCLDKADEDRNRELLRDVKPTELYEAGLTVMMRLVFILCAEERGLLLLGDPVYDQCYAVSTLRGQLAEEADRHGPEVLDRRHDAWARLLAVFRAVYGGIEHESLRMPALGGSLFDPDRFPFLEGRARGTCWQDTLAAPLPIDNRTVLLLLNSLQILEQSGGALLLSYRALDVEQIGHVYEGLLEHTVARVPHVTLGLQGTQKAKNPNVELAELESARLDGEAVLVKLIVDVTGRSKSAIKNGLVKPADDIVFSRVLGVCGGDAALAERIRPFTNLLRTDAWDDPIVYRDNSFMVTLGADRRETGTHYTPKSLTESIVTTTLEPVVYVGPAEGKPREEWALKSSREILDLKVCDPAMGSGAFLVQACRYLGEKLVEAWLHEEAAGKAITVDGVALDQLEAEEPLPSQLDERLTIARRLVAERCLYGVDINPLAVELAKLSIWLVTLAKGRPLGFLDHNLRSGDSLLGIHRLEQLTRLRMDTKSGRQYQLRIFGQKVEAAVNEAIELRKRLRATTIRDIKDVEAMARLDREARQKLEPVELIADAMIGEALQCAGNVQALDAALDTLATMADNFLSGNQKVGEQITRQAKTTLSVDLPKDEAPRRTFHWVLEFPEVFQLGGFDGIVGNPPFLGGKRISTVLGTTYNAFLAALHPPASKNTDLVAHFFRRAFALLRNGGGFGLLAVNTIAEGDTRQGGLEWMTKNGATIYKAYPSEPWPGKAAVVTSRVNVHKGEWEGTRNLSGKSVQFISAFLSDQEEWSPKCLRANENIAFQGSIVLGMGFVLSHDEAQRMLDAEPRNAEVIFPYLNGEDLNSDPEQRASRWVINFWDWSEDKASIYREPYRWIKERVFPERLEKSKQKSYRNIMSMWWQHWNVRPGLYHAIGKGGMFCQHPARWNPLEKSIAQVLVVARVSKTLAFALVDPSAVFADQIVVFAFNSSAHFALLQSNIHGVFAWQHSSKLKSDLRYSPSDAFETFPLPERRVLSSSSSLETLGETYHELRAEIMHLYDIGLTRLYRRFHDPDETDQRIHELRTLHARIDRIIAFAYGWNGIDLGHGFHEVPYLPENDRVRFTISEPTRIEVLRRLSELNRQRYEEEVAQGLHGKGSSRTSTRAPRAGRTASATTVQPSLDIYTIPVNENQYLKAAEPRAEYRAGPIHAIVEYLSIHPGWHAKADILVAIGITDDQWNAAIAELVSTGRVERQGERRGTRYRFVGGDG